MKNKIIKKIENLLENIQYGKIEVIIYKNKVKYINHEKKDKIE